VERASLPTLPLLVDIEVASAVHDSPKILQTLQRRPVVIDADRDLNIDRVATEKYM
jgi:hypothetical protein